MVARAAKDAMAPPGIPGVPTDRSTFARRITIIMEMLTLIPHALAKNMIMNDIRMDTASMFTVAPRGMAILVILLDTPISSSIRCLLMGMVAELEQVPKCVQGCRKHCFEEFHRAFFADEFHGAAVNDQGKSEECHIQDDQLSCQ